MFKNPSIKNKLPLVLTGFLLTLIATGLYLKKPMFLKYMDNKIYDIQLQACHQPDQTGIPIVIDIDEQSLDAFGQWPWPRYLISRLLEKIKQAGVSSVGLDILFAEPDRTSLKAIDHSMKTYFQHQIESGGSFIADPLPEELKDNDIVLARTLSTGNFVLGYAFDFSKNVKNMALKPVTNPLIKPLNPIIIQTPGAKNISECLKTAEGVIPPLAILSKNAVNTGFFNTSPDQDGILRATPLLLIWNKKIYPNLSLATLLSALGNPQVAIRITSGGIENMRIGPSTIPLDENGRFYVHYRGEGNQFKTISAALFLEDKIPPKSLQGKIAIVGTSAAGLKDLKATPLDAALMGAQIHTTVIDNILKGDFITRPDWIQGFELCVIFVFGILTTVTIVWARPWMTLVFSAVLCVMIWQFSIYVFQEKQIFLSPLFSFIILGLNFSVLSLFKFYFSEKDRIFLKKAFSNYVADDLVEDIVKNPDLLKLGGQVKTASVLFCDLKNFTNISEKRTPQEVVEIMSQYFEEMTQYVFKYKGALKDYIGDELMALFGAPLLEKEHAVNACRAALDMQRFLARLRQGDHPSLPPLYARVGVNTGEMLIGNIGSKYRFSYGIMGDNVNLGSRLEGLNKIYGTQIIIGQNTAQSAKDHFIIRKLGAVKVKGKQNPEKVYELIADKDQILEDNHKASIDCYNKGYAYYLKQEWSKAIEMFEKGHDLWPHDLSFTVMIQRCGMYKRLPYMENFDGIFIERRK